MIINAKQDVLGCPIGKSENVVAHIIVFVLLFINQFVIEEEESTQMNVKLDVKELEELENVLIQTITAIVQKYLIQYVIKTEKDILIDVKQDAQVLEVDILPVVHLPLGLTDDDF